MGSRTSTDRRGTSSARRGSRRGSSRRATSPVDVMLGLLLLGAIALGVLVLAPPFEEYLAERERVALLEQQALALENENLRLERRVTDLDDPVTIELLARSQQGLVRPGEVPYVLAVPEVDVPRIVEASPVPEVEADLLDRILAWLRALSR
jgi:cell division protein FtsB